VTNADLIEYFVIISQTCDICGQDKLAQPLAMILKAKSMRHLCRTEALPFRGQEAPQTIHEHFVKTLGFEDLDAADEHSYRAVLSKLWQAWKPANSSEEGNRGKVNNYLSAMQKVGPTYHLREDSERKIPPLYVDFLTAFTVTTDLLCTMKSSRIVTLTDAYRDSFAQAFATHLGRVALPLPMSAKSALG
jgi:hypothetical protein